MNKEISIIPFQREHQADINDMMERIASEFDEPIFSTQNKKIIDVYDLRVIDFGW